MAARRVDVVVVGAGQAGLATSRRLAERGVEHLVLDREGIGSTWLTRRWDSFRLVSPDHLNELPGGGPVGPDPDAFPTSRRFVDYLERYAAGHAAPVELGGVRRVAADDADGAGRGFLLATSTGPVRARAVVVATGAFGHPVVPAVAAGLTPRVAQLTTDTYRAPDALPPGGVLVVGSGQSGCQIADELARAGRETWLAVGRWGWVPRRPWGIDQMDWRLAMGDFERVVGDTDPPDWRYPFTPMARWGTQDFHLGTLDDSGVRLVGRILAAEGEALTLSTDVPDRLAAADAFATAFLARVHAFGTNRGMDLGSEPPVVSCWTGRAPVVATPGLDLARAGIGSVIWSTGYAQDFSWLALPALAPTGAPWQRRGLSTRVPGLAFVGLHRMWAGGSGTVLGVGADAIHVADAIADRLAGVPDAWPAGTPASAGQSTATSSNRRPRKSPRSAA
jgi:putative flavoprotein involved in K+ transport